jgi:hypothetical protein
VLRTLNTFQLAAVCIALALFTSFATGGNPSRSSEGKEWLAWTQAERSVFIQGFIEGFWGGSESACRLADKLFEVGKPHRLGDEPRGRCEAGLENYTKIKTTDSGTDYSVYTTVITDFYSGHPEYQNVPKVYLLSFLTDRNYKTADQLHQMAMKGEMRTHF